MLPDPELMDHNYRVELLRTIQRTLWFDFETGLVDPDKEWDADTIDAVASAMREAGLAPGGEQ